MQPQTLPNEFRPDGPLLEWFRAHVDPDTRELHARKFQGGQSNPTFLVSGGARKHVLRARPPGDLLASAHAVDREFRVIRALAATGVPVPRACAYCDDATVMGSPFYVTDNVEGRIFWNPALPDETPADRSRLYEAMTGTIATLHAVDPVAIGLENFGVAGQYLQRQVQRWTRQYRAAETEPIEAMERLIEWLPAHLPASEETRLVHGDFRIYNLIFHPSEPRVIAILDWELSTLGHPLVDFAYHCMTWRLPGMRGLGDHSESDLRHAGIPSEADYVRAYRARSGRKDIAPRTWNYYMVFNMFRLASILQGVLSRALNGNASSADALATGKRARLIAENAWHQVERFTQTA